MVRRQSHFYCSAKTYAFLILNLIVCGRHPLITHYDNNGDSMLQYPVKPHSSHLALNLSAKSGSISSTVKICVLSLVLGACSGGGTEIDSNDELDASVATVSTSDFQVVEAGTSGLGSAADGDEAAKPELGAAIVASLETSATDVTPAMSLDPTISELTANNAKIEWDAGEPVTGLVRYGLTDALDSTSANETSFAYSAHIQNITGLTPSTTYYYQVESQTQSGSKLNSPVLTFTTTNEVNTQPETVVAKPVVSTPKPVDSTPATTNAPEPLITQINPADWPPNTNDLLPMGGVFYGNFQQGMQTGNAALSIHSSRRFRAERSGYITAVSYPNRTLQDINITGRCLPSAPNSAWCKCVNAGLDKYTCGYTLSNSYSVGNGGSYNIQIRENNAATGEPSDVVLGELSTPFVPMNNAGTLRPELELAQPTYLQAGKIYHMVHWNQAPPTSCALRGVSISKAASCPRNQGAMGLNGIYLPVTVGLDDGLDPFRGKSGKNFTRGSNTGPWIADEDNITFYEVRYDDGTWVGESYAGFGGTVTGEGRKAIGDNIVARQVMTVRDATRIVDGLWLYFGHQYSRTPDGSPIEVTLKDEQGTALATGTIAYSKECAERSKSGQANGNRRDQHCRNWGYTDFSTEVALLEGNSYYVEFQAKASGAYYMLTFFPIDYGGYDSVSNNQWHDAHAEVSTNGGNTWDLWIGIRYPKRDFGMLFTIKDMPKRLP